MIVTLAELKERLKITGTESDAKLTSIIEALTDEVYTITGRSFGEVKTVIDEEHDFYPRIFLDNLDIVSVESIKSGYGATPTVRTDNIQFNSTGRVILSFDAGHRTSTHDFDEIRASYTFGIPEANVPADMKLAALDLAEAYYKTKEGQITTQHRVTSESIGTFRKTYAESTDVKAMQSVNNYETVLKKYTWKLKA